VVGDQVVELRDVMPTLLDSAGLSIPDGLDGHSLLRAADGDAAPLRGYLHGEHTYAGRQSVHAITDARYKYVWYSGDGHEQLFDLAGDPRELHDLADAPDSADVLAERRRRLVDELSDSPEGYVDGGRLVPGRQPFDVLPR
jgi:arylsulfatase A-like enzyme